MMTENKRSVLFFDAHPDDADWWSGGLAILLREKGWAVDFVCVAPAKENRGYADESASILGVTRHYLEIPVNDNDRFRGCLREAVLPLMETHKPDMVFIPAMTDSEIGLDMALWAIDKAHPETKGRSSLTLEEIFSSVPPFNPFLDLVQYARFIGESDELGILTIGGGVPRNWSQQVSPFFDLVCDRLGMSLRVPRFRYGVRTW